MTTNECSIEEKRELRFLAMDIKLFLRLASTNFPHAKDREVLNRLNDLADQYGAGNDIRASLAE